MHLGDNYAIQTIFAKELIEEPWEETTSLVVIPDGRDILFSNQLKGKGNEKIRRFVEKGGKYIWTMIRKFEVEMN